jgi:hypothetical protein
MRNSVLAGTVQVDMAKPRWTIAAVALVMVAMLLGCSQRRTPSAAGGSLSSGPTVSPSPSSVPTVRPTPTDPAGSGVSSPPTTGTPAGGTTLQGTVSEDESQKGCFLLAAQDHRIYLLLGGDRQLVAAGARLEVVGRAAPGLATTCRQGIPFEVSQARRI